MIHGIDQKKETYNEPTGQDSYQCEQCESTYKYEKNLKSHILLKHKSGDSPEAETLACDQCTSRFMEKRSLDAHKRIKHGSGNQEFLCPTCNKNFNQKKNLKRHQKIHEVE